MLSLLLSALGWVGLLILAAAAAMGILFLIATVWAKLSQWRQKRGK